MPERWKIAKIKELPKLISLGFFYKKGEII